MLKHKRQSFHEWITLIKGQDIHYIMQEYYTLRNLGDLKIIAIVTRVAVTIRCV